MNSENSKPSAGMNADRLVTISRAIHEENKVPDVFTQSARCIHDSYRKCFIYSSNFGNFRRYFKNDTFAFVCSRIWEAECDDDTDHYLLGPTVTHACNTWRVRSNHFHVRFSLKGQTRPTFDTKNTPPSTYSVYGISLLALLASCLLHTVATTYFLFFELLGDTVRCQLQLFIKKWNFWKPLKSRTYLELQCSFCGWVFTSADYFSSSSLVTWPPPRYEKNYHAYHTFACGFPWSVCPNVFFIFHTRPAGRLSLFARLWENARTIPLNTWYVPCNIYFQLGTDQASILRFVSFSLCVHAPDGYSCCGFGDN